MLPEFTIVEHTECIRCFQLIDERAQRCPHCQSEQRKPARWRAVLASAVLCVVIVMLGWFAWRAMTAEQMVRAAAQDLDGVSMQLEAAERRLTEMSVAVDEQQKMRRQIDEAMREDLRNWETHAGSPFLSLLQEQCRAAAEYVACGAAARDFEARLDELTELLSRFAAVGRGESVCDAVRPLLRALRTASPRLTDTYQRTYLATRACWGGK